MAGDEAPFPFLRWIHHASFRVESGGRTFYIDPYKLRGSKPADAVFVTHDHSDHYSPRDIEKIAKPGALLVCPERVAAKAAGLGLRILKVSPGDGFDADGLKGRAVPAYNRRKPMHPRKHRSVGFILDLPEGRLYHGGDTDDIDEMAGFSGVKVALLPLGKFLFIRPTMSPAQAARAVRAMNPDYAVPMHYGMLPGSRGDGAAFKAAVGEKAVLLEEEEPF